MKKRSIKEYLFQYNEPKLNIGCGKTNKPNFFGIDIVDNDGVDLVADCEKRFPFEDNTFNVVVAKDVLEHVIPQKSIHIMCEIYRVLKPGGIMEFMVPSTDGNNMGAFQDPTHYSFWNQTKFRYFYGDDVGGSLRHLYDPDCHFVPLGIETWNNEWNVTYVRGVLQKPELKED